jgi:predicted N-formylglutamate amidohydrolase
MDKKTAKKPVKKVRKAAAVLSAEEPAPFRVENVKGRTAGLIICDHASNRVPRSLKDMGLEKNVLKKHIAWDIGAEDICRHLSKALDMPAIFAGYSRLVVDLNRAPAHHECILDISDNIKIPANTGLSREDRERRLREVYHPYQKQAGKLVQGFVKKKQTPLLIAVHSFTPQMDGIRRPWHLSLLWHREEKIARQIVKNIRKNHPDLLVGENEPYTLFDERFAGSTLDCHGEERGLPYVFVEFRQDLINTKEKAARWADIFLEALRPVLENIQNYRDVVRPKK